MFFWEPLFLRFSHDQVVDESFASTSLSAETPDLSFRRSKNKGDNNYDNDGDHIRGDTEKAREA